MRQYKASEAQDEPAVWEGIDCSFGSSGLPSTSLSRPKQHIALRHEHAKRSTRLLRSTLEQMQSPYSSLSLVVMSMFEVLRVFFSSVSCMQLLHNHEKPRMPYPNWAAFKRRFRRSIPNAAKQQSGIRESMSTPALSSELQTGRP